VARKVVGVGSVGTRCWIALMDAGDGTEQMIPSGMAVYAQMCGWSLARAHACSGDRIALAAYLGGSGKFAQAIADFAETYADQNDRDYAALQAAVKDGRVQTTTDI
jgi:Uncharacterized protein conserved in bacteria (DUF2252)